MSSKLRALADLIVRQVDDIEAACAERNLELPSLEQLFSPESEAARRDAGISKAITLLNSAANEIGLVTRPAGESVLMRALGVSIFGLPIFPSYWFTMTARIST